MKINKVFVAISSHSVRLRLSETTNPQCRSKHELKNMNRLPRLDSASACDRKDAWEARQRDEEYVYAVAAGLSIRGNWRKRAAREIAAIEANAEADAEELDDFENSFIGTPN